MIMTGGFAVRITSIGRDATGDIRHDRRQRYDASALPLWPSRVGSRQIFTFSPNPPRLRLPDPHATTQEARTRKMQQKTGSNYAMLVLINCERASYFGGFFGTVVGATFLGGRIRFIPCRVPNGRGCAATVRGRERTLHSLPGDPPRVALHPWRPRSSERSLWSSSRVATSCSFFSFLFFFSPFTSHTGKRRERDFD